MNDLKSKLIVGAKIKIGPRYAKISGKNKLSSPKTHMSAKNHLYAIQSPEGDFIHTTISDSRESSIEEFILLENTKLYIVNSSRQIRGLPQLRLNGFGPFEDEGYKCVEVEIVRVKS